MQKSKPKVSIIILACNRSEFTELCLQSLQKTDYDNVELFLVDNGSTDNTPAVFDDMQNKLVAEKSWAVERITFPENVGAIAGRNAAIENFSGDYLCFMDNDIVTTEPDWLSMCVERMERDNQIGALGPKLVFPKPKHMLQCAGCVVTPTGRVDFFGRGRDSRQSAYNNERFCQCLISALMLVRGSVAREVGLLDMAFHPVQFEDIDYCYRIREKGYLALYFPGTFAYHYENVTTDGSAGINYRYITVKNGVIFKKRWKHMYERENGPADNTIEWLELPKVSWDEVKEDL